MADNITLILLIIVALWAYLMPTIIAEIRQAKHETGIVIVNLFLGWTLIGWIGALLWAASDLQE